MQKTSDTFSETRCSMINQFLLRVPYVLQYDDDQAVFPESSFCKFGNSTCWNMPCNISIKLFQKYQFRNPLPSIRLQGDGCLLNLPPGRRAMCSAILTGIKWV